ncbi:MAG: hypothetical protein AB7F43_11610 [Bacteriovoracia bacterium]
MPRLRFSLAFALFITYPLFAVDNDPSVLFRHLANQYQTIAMPKCSILLHNFAASFEAQFKTENKVSFYQLPGSLEEATRRLPSITTEVKVEPRDGDFPVTPKQQVLLQTLYGQYVMQTIQATQQSMTLKALVDAGQLDTMPDEIKIGLQDFLNASRTAIQITPSADGDVFVEISVGINSSAQLGATKLASEGSTKTMYLATFDQGNWDDFLLGKAVVLRIPKEAIGKITLENTNVRKHKLITKVSTGNSASEDLSIHSIEDIQDRYDIGEDGVVKKKLLVGVFPNTDEFILENIKVDEDMTLSISEAGVLTLHGPQITQSTKLPIYIRLPADH